MNLKTVILSVLSFVRGSMELCLGSVWGVRGDPWGPMRVRGGPLGFVGVRRVRGGPWGSV